MTAARKFNQDVIQLSHFNGVKASVLFEQKDFILDLAPTEDPAKLILWVQQNKPLLREALLRWGAIRFHGFSATPAIFAQVTDILFPDNKAMDYTGGVSSRSKYGKEELYLSTVFPKEGTLPQHHEMSYLPKGPRWISFFCDVPSETGGETPICSARAFAAALGPKLMDLFAREKVMYIRNYMGDLVGPDWKTSFLTKDRAQVEKFCRDGGMDFEWLPNDKLRTKNVCQGVTKHPDTNETLWHNHAYLMTMRSDDASKMTPALKMMAPSLPPGGLEQVMKSDHLCLPWNAYFGNGSFISAGILEAIHEAYQKETVAFQWVKGDFVVIDNLIASHGRNPFTGDGRRILTVLK